MRKLSIREALTSSTVAEQSYTSKARSVEDDACICFIIRKCWLETGICTARTVFLQRHSPKACKGYRPSLQITGNTLLRGTYLDGILDVELWNNVRFSVRNMPSRVPFRRDGPAGLKGLYTDCDFARQKTRERTESRNCMLSWIAFNSFVCMRRINYQHATHPR